MCLHITVDVKFLYARCCARQLKWLRFSDMKNWQERLGSGFASALRELSNNPDLLMPPKTRSERATALRSTSPKRPRVSPSKRPLRKQQQVEIIDLVTDDEDDGQADPPASTSTSTSPAPVHEPHPVVMQQENAPNYTSFMQWRSIDSPNWEWSEILEILTVAELKEMAKMLVLHVTANSVWRSSTYCLVL